MNQCRIVQVLASFPVALLVLLAVVTTAAAPAAVADRTEPLPRRLQGIGVDEHLGTLLPRGIEFRDSTGRRVTLGQYFTGEYPVIVTLNYSNCPMLCSLQLNGFVETLKQLDFTPGADFLILTVSLDPDEKPEKAAAARERYLGNLGRAGAEKGWQFLTGDERSVRRLADALGIRYGYNEKRAEYVHPAVLSIVSPNARVARYLYGIEYLPKTLKLSLAEASRGKLGSTVDQLILYCFHYDESEGRYAPVARKLMTLGGALAVTLLGSLLAALWLGELRKRHRVTAESTT